ncbi:hypothetical protein F4801DRAFT_543869 [Xylaria longipes]|nr:hypothetical protein F4801DRAFT_543869 [Xylaria longipes]
MWCPLPPLQQGPLRSKSPDRQRKMAPEETDASLGQSLPYIFKAAMCTGVSCTLSLQNVTCLTLLYCSISTNDMNRLLLSCGTLDTFIYGNADLTHDDEEGISANELVRILGEHGHSRTLRRLALDYEIKPDLAAQGVGSLVGFHQLQDLWLWSVFMFTRWPEVVSSNAPVGVLPASLREIGLDDDPAFINYTLEQFAAQASNGFVPGLNRLTIKDWGWYNSGGSYNDMALIKLRRIFQQFNIACCSCNPGGELFRWWA